MRKCAESGLEFDFSKAHVVYEHDRTSAKCDGSSTADGNTYWPGVDFRIEEDTGWIWLEIKNWRGRMQGSFRAKLMSKAYAEEMRSKFLGTTSFLAWNNAFTSGSVRYILLFEPPTPFDRALLAPFQDFVRQEMSHPDKLDIRTYVFDVRSWNTVFTDYPVRKQK